KNQGEEGKDCEGPCSQDCSILTKSINIFTGGGLIPIISFALAALIILGAAIGFVLVRKHGGHEYYKAPTQQTPAELAEGLPTVPEGELPAVPQQKHEEEDEIIKIEPKELPEFDVQNSDLDYLIKYVNVEQAKGVLNSSIRVALMRAKWPTQMIDESFERTECTRKLVELDKYIKKARKAGQDDDSIRHKLLSAKWAEHFIDMVMHEVHVLHDDFDKIKAYANSLFSKGYSKKDILKTLTDVGWSKADVKLYIEE
ncbi:hypothetical protein GOV08_01465, partial [Candidatus Woesearchaeota archaeon]|nr:hypothetical protein [Candidatus Woesearchaeota archaeon]